MEIKLHANATTTPRIRRYLQQSDKSDRELAVELGISVTTVRRWRNREQVSDNHTTPKVIHKALRQEQVALVNALRDIRRAAG
jgi:transcriptional regulator with XRE-family HTH domain